MEQTVKVVEGESPLVLATPHAGTLVPEHILLSLNERGHALDDTDWHVDRLYDGLLPGVTTVRALFSRYVIDVNRPPGGDSLYPGQNTTGLCPLTDFDGRPIYLPGQEPDEAAVKQRRQHFHAVYHNALRAQLERVRAIHGIVVLYDCHSVRSVIPYLFDGELPMLNVGTAGGTSCDSRLQAAVEDTCRRAGEDGFSWVVNGRFKGGWTTRHYGQPAQGVHAIQMELAQRTYLDEQPPWTYHDERAARVRHHLGELLERLQAMAFKIT